MGEKHYTVDCNVDAVSVIWKKETMLVQTKYEEENTKTWPAADGDVCPANTKHGYNIYTTSKTLVQRFINVIQIFCVCWVGVLISVMTPQLRSHELLIHKMYVYVTF